MDLLHSNLASDTHSRIAWVGDFADALTQGCPPSLNVFLVSVEGPERGYDRLSSELRKTHVPIGEYPLLPIGSVVSPKGKILTTPKVVVGKERAFTVEMDLSRENLSVIPWDQQDESGQFVIEPTTQIRQLQKLSSGAGLFVAVGQGDEQYKFLIPCTEIMRFFYCRSNRLANALGLGWFSDPSIHLWNTELTALDPANGTAHIRLRKWMADSDRKLLAHFALDQYAFEQAQAIFEQAAARKASGSDKRVRALPHIQGKFTIRFVATVAREEGSERYFVRRLIHCDWQPPFTKLNYSRDNDATVSPDSIKTNKPSGWADSKKHSSGLNGGKRTTDDPPGDGLTETVIQDEGLSEGFPGLNAIDGEFIPTAEYKHENGPLVFDSGAPANGTVSTQKPIRSKDIIEKARIEGTPFCGDFGLEIEDTSQVDPGTRESGWMSTVRQIEAAASVDLIEREYVGATNEILTQDGIIYSVFPRAYADVNTSWLYIDQERRQRRLAIVAKIQHQGKVRYLIEFQPKQTRTHSSLAVWNESESDLSTHLLFAALISTAKAECPSLRGLPTDLIYGYRSKHFRREATEKKDLEVFVGKLFKLLPMQWERLDDASRAANI